MLDIFVQVTQIRIIFLQVLIFQEQPFCGYFGQVLMLRQQVETSAIVR